LNRCSSEKETRLYLSLLLSLMVLLVQQLKHWGEWQMAVHLGTLVHLVRMTWAPQLSGPRRTQRNWQACKPARMIHICTRILSRFKFEMTWKLLMANLPTRIRI